MHLPSHWDPASPWILQIPSLPVPPTRGGMAATGNVGEGVNAPPRPLRPPCVTPRCIYPATGIPPLHGFCKYLSLPVPSMKGGMAAAGNVGEGVNALPPPLAAPVCDPKMHLPSHWAPASPWILQIPFPACSLDAGRYGGGGKRRGRGQCPSPLSACFPLKYSGGATGSPAVIDVADMAAPTPVRTPTGCAGCRTNARRCPRIFVPAGGGGSSWWGSAPRSRCSRGS